MKRIITASAIALSSIIMSCNSNNEKQSESMNHNHEEAADSKTPATNSVQFKDENVNAVYQHYVHLTNALIKEDAAEARVAANAIETGAKSIPGAASFATTAAKISGSGDIAVQREAYSDLSNQMIELAKKSGLSTGEVYVDFCPMARNDQGAYWLSTKKEILNPYYGDKMLNCGEIRETVK